MKSFKQFITEGRDAPLYHATNFDFLEWIVKEGIEPRTYHLKSQLLKEPGYNDLTTGKQIAYMSYKRDELAVTGVSTTRNFRFAKSFSVHGPILELDQRRLSQRYEIVPIQFFVGDAVFKTKSVARKSGEILNEYEEFILTKTPIPFSYVTRLIIPERASKWRTIKKIADTYGSTFIMTY